MYTMSRLAACLLLFPVIAAAQDLPEAPRTIVDKKFAALAVLSTASSFADSYTTTWARQNWLAGKTDVCNIERESAYLYGTHPTAPRAYAVAAGKSIGSAVLSLYLRKRNHKFWSVPLVVNSLFGLQGMSQNLVMCN